LLLEKALMTQALDADFQQHCPRRTASMCFTEWLIARQRHPVKRIVMKQVIHSSKRFRRSAAFW